MCQRAAFAEVSEGPNDEFQLGEAQGSISQAKHHNKHDSTRGVFNNSCLQSNFIQVTAERTMPRRPRVDVLPSPTDALLLKSRTRPGGPTSSSSSAASVRGKGEVSGTKSRGVGQHASARRNQASDECANVLKVPATAREKFRARKQTWCTSAGSHRLPTGTKIVWLAEKESSDFEWGMGCILCSQLQARLAMRSNHQGASGTERRAYSSKWARFEIRGIASVQTSAIRLHAKSDMHLAAWRLFQLPPGVGIVPTAAAKDQDIELLRGSVPQPEDWLQCWRHNELALSCRASSRISLTNEFIHSDRLALKEVERRAVASMRVVLQEVIREKKRNELRRAEAITISVDDKSPYRLIRFKSVAENGEITRGMFGLIPPLAHLVSKPEDWDRDKSEAAAGTIISAIRAFCTPLNKELDSQLFDRISKTCPCSALRLSLCCLILDS